MEESKNHTDDGIFQCKPIGFIRSCFKEKFGIPRQPGLVSDATAILELTSPYNQPEAFSGLEGFTHIWLIFIFHKEIREQWRPMVRPPRLGGNQRIGVFASRSPFRPNHIGLSVVSLDKVECDGNECRLHLRGADLLDGTPVLDVKPYLPYADAIPDAVGGYATNAPEKRVSVSFTELAESQIANREQAACPGLRKLIEQVIAQDPRPAYVQEQKQDQRFGIRLYDFDVQWQIKNGEAKVVELRPL